MTNVYVSWDNVVVDVVPRLFQFLAEVCSKFCESLWVLMQIVTPSVIFQLLFVFSLFLLLAYFCAAVRRFLAAYSPSQLVPCPFLSKV